MRRTLSAAMGVFLLCGCGGNPAPPPPPTEDAARLECDRLAARAIQVASAAEAAALSGRAAECYDSLRVQP